MCSTSSPATRPWTSAEIELVADAAALVELALDKLRVIAARDAALAASRRTADDLAALIATTTTGVLFETDAHTVHVVNARFCDLAGAALRPDQLVGADCRAVARQLADLTVDPAGFLRKTEAIMAAGEAVSGEVFSLVDGRWIERDYVRVGAHANERGHLWLYRDVTAQRRDQELLRHLERAIEQSPVGVIVTDAKGQIVWVNERFSRISGFARDEVIGRNPRFQRSDETDAETFAALWSTITAGREWTGEVTNRHKSGELLPIRLTVSPVLDEWQRITHYVAVQEDLREERRAAEALRAADERLRLAQKMEAVSRFAGGVAHDFNNLLSVILSYTGIVISEMPASDPLSKDLAQVEVATERAAALSRRLLAFSRRDALDPRSIVLNDAIGELNRVLRRLLGEDIDLVIELDEGAGAVWVDPSQLEQAVLNLASNARDAMPYGGTLTVSSSVAEVTEDRAPGDAPADLAPGVYTVLTVADTGTGMDEATRARVFDPFFTTKEVGKGTGLGLTIVQDFVRQSGGGVLLESRPGVGSEFALWLPRRSSGAKESVVSRDISRPPGGAQQLVLVVEDESDLRTVLRRILVRGGYRVAIASNGGEALLWCERHGADAALILCDVVMPGLRGPELVRRIAPLCPNAKVLFMSGYLDGSDRRAPVGRAAPREALRRQDAARARRRRAHRGLKRRSRGSRRHFVPPSVPRRSFCASPRSPRGEQYAAEQHIARGVRASGGLAFGRGRRRCHRRRTRAPRAVRSRSLRRVTRAATTRAVGCRRAP